MYEAVQRLHPERQLEAAGYIRVSLQIQAEGHSPDVQREAIRRLAAEQGYALSMLEQDTERGSEVTRAGYQRIIEAVRAGTIHAVIVFMFDRWGRGGAEWVTRADEFDRLGVPIISVQEGRDQAGLLRFMRAGMAEEYSRQLAKRVRPGRERGAQSGIHQGKTNVGFTRVYPAHTGTGRRPPGLLIVDDATAWMVRELFTRYAAGGCSTGDLAAWCNSDPRCVPSPKGKGWRRSTIGTLLRNPIYLGKVRYNVRPQGKYARATTPAFVAQGKHEALVDEATFDAVQGRLSAARTKQTYNRRQGPSGKPTALGASLLRCACGATMFRQAQAAGTSDQYRCSARHARKSACAVPGYSVGPAEHALLAELRRLRGAPWTPQAEQRLLGKDPAGEAEAAAALKQALEAARERYRRHTRALSLLDADPTAEEIAAVRDVGKEIAATIRALEGELAAIGERAARVPDLKLLHARLLETQIAPLVETMTAAGDAEGLRELALALVDSARVVERYPACHSAWLRVAVTWMPDVCTLLDAGLLWLEDPAPRPAFPSRQEQRQAAKARYRAKVRGARAADRRNAGL